MTNADNKISKLDYLKFLLSKGEQSALVFNNSFGKFYVYSLAFFLLLQLKTTEINLFGAKMNIPLEWIFTIAPIVLSFCYLRLISLYELQENYYLEIYDTAKGLLGKKKNSTIQAAKISKTVFWFSSFHMIEKDRGLSYLFIFILISFSAIVATFFLPIAIIGYFNWMAWNASGLSTLVLTLLSGVSVLSSLVGIVTFFVVFTKKH